MQYSSTQMQRVVGGAAVQQTYVLRWSWSGVNLCGERKKKKQNNQPSNMRWEKTTRKLTKKITFRLRAIAAEKLEHLEKERNKEFFSTVKKSGSTIKKKDWKLLMICESWFQFFFFSRIERNLHWEISSNMRSIFIFIIQLGWIGLTLQQQQQQPLTGEQRH